MNGSVITSNVYYLPVRGELPDAASRPPEHAAFAARCRRAWWRLRFSGAEIWLIMRRTARHLWSDNESVRLQRVEATERVRSAGPARIIDFVDARRRLRRVSE